jgi:GxxExxY protein
MKSNEERERLNATTRDVLGCAFRVSNALGHGFLEKVYENALAIELRAGEHFVLYRGRVVGEYCPDLVVDGGVVIEIKAIDRLESTHVSQCLNYLRATGLSVALLVNFGLPRIQYKRVVWDF